MNGKADTEGHGDWPELLNTILKVSTLRALVPDEYVVRLRKEPRSQLREP
jgi:hypothetical protein